MLLKELSPGARGRIVALRKEQPEYRDEAGFRRNK